MISQDEIRSFRKYLGMSVREFSEFLKISSRTVVNWENGSYSVPESVSILINIMRRYPNMISEIVLLSEGYENNDRS